MKTDREKNDQLVSLTIIGKILIFTPIITALPPVLYAAITGKNFSIGYGGAGFAAGLMINAGLITLIYVSVARFRGN